MPAVTSIKVGDFVKVYQKPLTQEEYEGIGRVTQVIERTGDVARVRVAFRDDPGVDWLRDICAPFEIVPASQSGF